MLKTVFQGIQIAAVATAVPTTEVTAADMYEKFGKEIVDKTIRMIGVTASRQSKKKQISSDLGFVAAEQILREKGIDPATIGVLIVITQTPDYRVPSTAFILQKRLGIPQDCAVFDMNLGCSGFIYGMHVACSMLQNLNCQRALCIVGDTSSKLGSSESRSSSLLFGDGTSAILLEKSEDAPALEFALRSDGNRYPAIIVPYGEFRSATYTEEELREGYRGERFPLMDGTGVFTFSIQDVTKLMNEFLTQRGEEISEYNCVVLHQANLYMMKQIAKKIKAKPEQLLVSIDRFGNTSGASIPLTLVDRYGQEEQGEINALMSGFGVGLSWGVMSAKIRKENILPMIYSDDYYQNVDSDLQNNYE